MKTDTLQTRIIYSTSDLALATAISLFFPLEAIDRTNPSKSQFIFKREEGLDELVESYWKNDLKVSPLIYFTQLKTLKSRLYEQNYKLNKT